MAVYSFDFRKAKPATGGARRDYIKPGKYKLRVKAYSDKASGNGKEMHTFTFSVLTKGEEANKEIIDRFAMPKTARDSQFPVERLLAFFLAAGAKNAVGKQIKLDPARLVGKDFEAEIADQREEARTVDGTTYPARTVSAINRYIFDGDEDEPEDEEDEEEEDDEEEDEDEDDEEEDEEEEDDEDEDEDEDEEEDEEEEEPEPAPKPRRSSRASSAATASSRSSSKSSSKTAAKAPAKAAAEAPAAKAKRSSKSDDDFPFDD